MKKILALLLCVVMCLSLAVTAFAEDYPTLVATLDKTTVNQSATEQTVTLNVALSKEYDVFSLDYEVDVPDGFVIESVESGSSTLTYSSVSTDKTTVGYYASADVKTTNLAKITVKVPANADATTYNIGIKNVKVSTNGKGKWINGGSVYATLEVKDPTVYVTGITLNKTATTVGIGRSETLVATVLPANATTNKTVTWTSSDPEVATVENGKVTGLKKGNTTITATVPGKEDAFEASCVVTVEPVEVTGVVLSASKTSIGFNKSTDITATISPDDYYAQGYTYRYVWSLEEDKDNVHENDLATISTYDAGDFVTLTANKTKGTVTVYFKLYKQNSDALDFVKGASIDIKITEGLNDLLAELIDDDMKFRDVSRTDYFYRPVAWAVNQGITDGMSRYTFAPEAACTRAQTVTFLWRAAGCPAPKTTNNPFTDVYVTDYYYDAVLWAVENGITNGTSATTFSPNATVTRAEVVTLLWRAEGEPGASMSNVFTDVPADAYYAEAVAWAVDMGITEGVSSTSFAPNAACTRAQIVTFLYRNR